MKVKDIDNHDVHESSVSQALRISPGLPDIFQVFFPGTHRSTRESKHNDVIVISGKKGSGKTELAKFMAYVYHQQFPRNRVIIFSGIRDLYADLPSAVKVDLKKVEQEEEDKSKTDYPGVPDASEFRDSLVIFDDTEKMPNIKVEKMLYQLVNVLAQNGRNFGTNVICILHQLNKGLQSSTLLREADTFVIFPKSYDINTFNTLVHHLGFSKEDAQTLYAHKHEWFILIHQTVPSYVYLGSSMRKIYL
jgi:energy-coupling factor transporter ATP-binding protein EcfA2